MTCIPSSIRSLYPFASHFLDLGDGVRMHYVDEGSGRAGPDRPAADDDSAVVMVHGNPTWSFYFRELIGAVSRFRRVIALDHVGCGLSDKPATYSYTLATHIANLTRFLDHLRIRRASLVMHDWGGAIGMGWAVCHPEQVDRLVVLNTAAFHAGRIPLRIAMCRFPWFGALMVRGLNAFVRSSFFMATRKPGRFTGDLRRGYLLPYDSWAHRIGVHRFVQDIPCSPADPSYAVIAAMEDRLSLLRDKPMLIVWGGRDFCFHDAFLHEWCIRFPEAVVHRFSDAGHFVLEDAAEEAVPLIASFLSL